MSIIKTASNQWRSTARARIRPEWHHAPTISAQPQPEVGAAAGAGGEFARQLPAALGAIPVNPAVSRLSRDLLPAHCPQIRQIALRSSRHVFIVPYRSSVANPILCHFTIEFNCGLKTASFILKRAYSGGVIDHRSQFSPATPPT